MAERDFHEYSPEWPRRFDEECVQLERALDGAAVCIEHVGSTAIPGMPGKGIIDILLTVRPGTAKEAFDRPLRELGYIERPVDRPDPFYTKPSIKPRTHNVHVAEAGSDRARSLLAFRDYLRAYPEQAARYAQLKRQLADHESPDWARYSAEKLGLAAELEAAAVAWSASQDA